MLAALDGEKDPAMLGVDTASADATKIRTLWGRSAMARDPHATLSPTEARTRGCTCEFGCPRCGYPLAMMGNCPSFHPCPVGREADPDCPLEAEHGA